MTDTDTAKILLCSDCSKEATIENINGWLIYYYRGQGYYANCGCEAMSYTTLSNQQARELLNYRAPRRTGVHNMSQKVLHWPYCGNCGLVALKNDISRKALRQVCTWEE